MSEALYDADAVLIDLLFVGKFHSATSALGRFERIWGFDRFADDR